MVSETSKKIKKLLTPHTQNFIDEISMFIYDFEISS
jgi:hypothetical protein